MLNGIIHMCVGHIHIYIKNSVMFKYKKINNMNSNIKVIISWAGPWNLLSSPSGLSDTHMYMIFQDVRSLHYWTLFRH